MRLAAVGLGAFVSVASPAWATTQECENALAQAVAQRDGARIDAFLGSDQRYRETILAWRETLEIDIASIVVIERQLQAIQQIEQSGLSDEKHRSFLNLLKQKLQTRRNLFNQEAKVAQEVLEHWVQETCVKFAKREQTARTPPARTPPAPTLGGPPIFGVPPQAQVMPPPVDRRPPEVAYGTSAVLQQEGSPVPSPKYEPIKTVEPGKIHQEAPGYKGTYTWEEIPQTIGPEGVTIKLTVRAESTAPQSSIATGITLAGGFVFTITEGKDQEGVVQGAKIEVAANAKGVQTVTKTVSVHIKPNKQYTPNEDVLLSVGMFYGPYVAYKFKPLRTGQ
jgi:hypothetical protein